MARPLLLVLAFLVFFLAPATAQQRSGIDLSLIDTAVQPQEDFWRYANGKWLAATLRFRTVIDTYQTTSHTPEALYRLVESYLTLGIPTEAQKAAAVLGSNYPGSEWYARAYRLMEHHAPGTAAS